MESSHLEFLGHPSSQHLVSILALFHPGKFTPVWVLPHVEPAEFAALSLYSLSLSLIFAFMQYEI